MLFSKFAKIITKLNKLRNYDAELTVTILDGEKTRHFKIKQSEVYGMSSGFRLVIWPGDEMEG
jgi:hypothetical protein